MNHQMFKQIIMCALFFSLGACSSQVNITPPSLTTTVSTQAATTRASPASAGASLTHNTPTPKPLPLPPQPTPMNIIGGGTIQNGPFTFFLWLFRDPTMNQHPDITSLYSDLNGFGIYKCWVYQGPDLSGPVHFYWGTVPQLNEVMEYPALTDGQGDGGSGGILLPGGFFMPGRSKPGDEVQVAMKVVTPQREYGAVLAFTLQHGANGFEPTNIKVTLLPPGIVLTP